MTNYARMYIDNMSDHELVSELKDPDDLGEYEEIVGHVVEVSANEGENTDRIAFLPPPIREYLEDLLYILLGVD